MNSLLRVCVAAACGSMLVVLAAGNALAERRIALVVGNSQYKNSSLNLANPRNDAEDVSAALRNLGFEVMQKTDSSKRDLELAMAQFARQSTNADVALFFYAGHALQYQGRNYLMPVDSTLEDEVSLRYQMMSVEDVRSALERASGVKIMILDACRNNPVVDTFKRKMSNTTRALESSRGLARIDKTEGMVVAYATAADDVAADGSGRNSPYTTALLKRLQEPGLEIEIMFRRIAADVNAQTNGRQRPETYVSLINEYYLNQQDRQVWDKIKDSNDPAVFDDFIRRYPSSILMPDAIARERQAEKEAADRRTALLREQEQQRAQAAAVAARERAQREAALKRQQDEQQRAQAAAAAAEKERLEREAALKRQQDEQQRAQAAAAAAEKERVEREAALKRQQDEQRRAQAAAAAEKERVEREAALKRQQEDQRRAQAAAAAAAAEKERVEREAALKRQQDEQRMQLASIERQRQETAAAQKLRDEEQRRLQADAERQKQQRDAALKVVPVAVPQEQACKQDAEQLARLRASQDKDAVLHFKNTLACDRLRPQVTRLLESLGITEEASSRSLEASASRRVMIGPAAAEQTPALPSQDEQRQRAEAERQRLEREAALQRATATLSQEEACKRDGEKLIRLRANQVKDEVIRFERELACERLRPQVVRLRESLAD